LYCMYMPVVPYNHFVRPRTLRFPFLKKTRNYQWINSLRLKN